MTDDFDHLGYMLGYVNVTVVVNEVNEDSVTLTVKGFVLGREYFWHEDLVVNRGNSLHIHQKVELSRD